MRTNLPSQTIHQIIKDLCPEFGTKGSNKPVFDSSKHSYLVDQHQFESGNRTLTYAAVSENMVVEFILGHHHCMEYINSMRVLVPDGKRFKVVQTYKWELKTHFSLEELKSTLHCILEEYIRANSGNARYTEEELSSAVDKMVSNIFSKTTDFLDEGGRLILSAYCEQNRFCID